MDEEERGSGVETGQVAAPPLRGGKERTQCSVLQGLCRHGVSTQPERHVSTPPEPAPSGNPFVVVIALRCECGLCKESNGTKTCVVEALCREVLYEGG